MNPELGRLLREELSGERAKAHVEAITQFHRIQASPMFHEAAKYVRDQLLKIGLEGVRVEAFPSDGSRRYWTFLSPIGWEAEEAELWLVEPERRLLARYPDIPTSLHVHSRSTPPDGVAAELVDVGSGLRDEEYAGKDVKGKFVLATGRAGRVHRKAVFRYGAAAVLTDALTFEVEGMRESIDLPDAHAYQAIWPSGDEVEKVTFGFSISRRQGNHLRKLLRNGKPVKLWARVKARLMPGLLEVATAEIPGSSRPDEEVFLIAHLCHPRPSANDNASGSGLLIEIARAIHTLISRGKIPRPARTIRFLWVPEFYGTVAYLCQHEDLPKRLVAGVNLDMVGQDQEACKSTLIVDRTPDSLPSYLNDLMVYLLEQAEEEFDPPTGFGRATTFRYRASVHTGGSDHHVFVDSTIGVPCVMLLQWPDLYYHSSMDTIDKVSTETLKRVGWVAAMAILILADAGEEEAIFLANETRSRGAARVRDLGRRAVGEILVKSKDEDLRGSPNRLAEELARAIQFHRNRVEHAVRREVEAIRSVRRLATGPVLDSFIQKGVEELSRCGEEEILRIEEVGRAVAEKAGISLPSVEEGEEERMIPKRRFKGPLSMEFLRRAIGEDEYEWYERMRREDRLFHQKLDELLNFMDGRRTLHEILLAVSAEYGELKVEHAKRFLRDLERAGLVELRGEG